MSKFDDALNRLRTAQKSSSGAAAYSRYVNRPLGRVIAAACYSLGLTPTQVTMISAALTMSGIAIVAAFAPTIGSSIAVAVLLILGYAFDSADGQVARLTGTSSSAGEWLDHFIDALKIATLHLAVAVCWFRFYELPSAGLLAVPLAFSAIASTFFFGLIVVDLLRRLIATQAPSVTLSVPARAYRNSPLYSLVVIVADYGLLCLIFLLLWWQPAFILIYSALAAVNLVILAISAVRWYRSVRALEKQVAR